MKQSLHFSLLQLLSAAIIALFVPTNASAQSADDYRVEAEQGDAMAQFNLGLCYDNGEGVDQNYAEAAKWYRKAAEQGVALAQYNLGQCYYNGIGVTQNYAEAVKWYRKAAEQGHAMANRALSRMEERW